ncbi:hypothetical protein F4859DRAFT_491896 [Xylaria cf. heliscus]|nr:hypothetical protein F4859DRAFT_491896 [Xylaria cf. heliscus]
MAFSYDFRLLVARCMAQKRRRHPTPREVLDVCERNVRSTVNWRRLSDVVAEQFDNVPPADNDSGSESEYVP